MKLRRCLLLAAVGALLNLGISGCGNSEEFVFTQGAVVNPNVPPNGIWALHVWVGTENPTGIFQDFNPEVNCDFALED